MKYGEYLPVCLKLEISVKAEQIGLHSSGNIHTGPVVVLGYKQELISGPIGLFSSDNIAIGPVVVFLGTPTTP